MDFAEFTDLVNRHDLTYSYSDDGRAYERGSREYAAIKDAAKQFPAEDVERVWNEMVDKSLIPEARAQFYWRV